MAPMVRKWVLHCGIFEEIRLEGFEPQWRLFLRPHKKGTADIKDLPKQKDGGLREKT